MVWYGMVWYGMVWYGMVEYSITQYRPSNSGFQYSYGAGSRALSRIYLLDPPSGLGSCEVARLGGLRGRRELASGGAEEEEGSV